MHPIINNNIKVIYITILIEHKKGMFFHGKGESADKRCGILFTSQMHDIFDFTVRVNDYVYFTNLHNH